MTHGAGVPPVVQLLAPVLVVAAAAAYATGVARLHRRGDSWPASRSAAAGAGSCLLLATLFPPLGSAAGFRFEIARHLTATTAAPAVLALAAPVTLALRTLPSTGRRLLVAALRSRLARVASSAPAVLAAAVPGAVAYYLTPLYAAAHHRPWLHAAVHGHMVAAGYLLSWYLVGRDPVPAAPAGRRLAVLLVAAGSHETLAKLMYARGLPRHAGPPADVRLGAQLLFYGGDVVTVALAAAIMSDRQARESRGHSRAWRRGRRTLDPPGAGSPAA